MKTALILGVLVAGCGGDPSPQPVAAPNPLENRLMEIARTYGQYGRVDDESRWAPYLCRMPNPSRARFSEADGPHGRKLYFVSARDRQAYVSGATQPQPAEQVVVKESWIPVEAAAEEAPRGFGRPITHARRDGRLYRTGERAGLYIMIKTGGSETDAGWVYGTVSADGKVTSSGRVASCMSCHREAKSDRLFGLPSTEQSR